MQPDGLGVSEILRSAKVARLATLSSGGRPSVNPLYFIQRRGEIWLGTADWTLAARNVAADERVTLLIDIEGHPHDQRVLRIHGRARLRADRATIRAYNVGTLVRYVLNPGGILDLVQHARQLPLRKAYYAQSAHRGRACVIAVTLEHVELLSHGRSLRTRS